MPSVDCFIPQTVLALRGSGGVVKEGLWFLCGSVRARLRSQTSVFTWFGEGHSRLVQAKWSLFSFSMVKHIYDLDDFHEITAWMPRCLDVWMPGWLDAWMPGCLDAWMPG